MSDEKLLTSKKRTSGEKFVSGWINLAALPGSMMISSSCGKYGPVPGTTGCLITTSPTVVEEWKQRGQSVLEIQLAESAVEGGEAPATFNTAVEMYQEVRQENERLKALLEICERKASAVETTAPQAPIAKIAVTENGSIMTWMYAPGLPPGEHDLYCEPEAMAPYLRAKQSPVKHDERCSIWDKGSHEPLKCSCGAQKGTQETPAPRDYTALDYVGNGPLPDCDMCHKPYAAHGQMDECPPENGSVSEEKL